MIGEHLFAQFPVTCQPGSPEGNDRRQLCLVGEYIFDEDLFLVGMAQEWEVIAHPAVKFQFALSGEADQGRQGPRHLGHRSKIIEMVGSDFFLFVIREVTVAFVKDHLPLAGHQELATGIGLFGQSQQRQGIHFMGQKGRGDAGFFGEGIFEAVVGLDIQSAPLREACIGGDRHAAGGAGGPEKHLHRQLLKCRFLFPGHDQRRRMLYAREIPQGITVSEEKGDHPVLMDQFHQGIALGHCDPEIPERPFADLLDAGDDQVVSL